LLCDGPRGHPRKRAIGYIVAMPDPRFSGAEAYERFMGRWSRQLAPLLVRFAGVHDGDAVLDVGAGTGALAAAISSSAPTSRVTGIDPAPAYVEFARATRSTGLVDFETGDAERLRFGDGSFDRALSLLVITFIANPRQALREIRRVTRAGGTIAAAVWDYPEGMEMLRVFWDTAVALRPMDAHKDERHLPLCRRGDLGALWREEGLLDIAEDSLIIRTRFASFDDYWEPFLEKQGPAGAYVGTLTAAEREDLKARLRVRLLEGEPDRPFALTARAWAVRGTVAARSQEF
jgi:SAM-dependent methyltransferase